MKTNSIFISGTPTMKAIYLPRRLMERSRKKEKDVHILFTDLQDAYDRIPKQVW